MLRITSRGLMTVSAASVLLGLAACSSSDTPSTALVTRVVGTVQAAGGDALDEYATVVFTPAGGGTGKSAQAGTDGTYSLDLAPGTYDAIAARPGYEDSAKTGVAVVAGQIASIDFPLAELAANVYIGSAKCGICHDGQYQTFRQTGHPFKLNKVSGAAPTYPFTDIDGVEKRIDDDDTAPGDPKPGTDNTLGTPAGWSDISYVVGGFSWKARFLDANGYVVTGSEVQYNFETDAMVAYHDNEVDKPFNCGNCHTTGWQHFDPTVNSRRQEDLAGMDGTFTETGIGCEACHGAGSTHARTGKPGDTTLFAAPRQTADFMDGKFAYGKPVDCSECHTRDGERDYPSFMSAYDNARTAASLPVVEAGGRIAASGGLVRHHEQYDEMLGVDPDTLWTTRGSAFLIVHGNCVICHDPHKATVWRDSPDVTEPGVDPTNANCLRCHSAARFEPANNARPQGSMKNLNCVDCHMPKGAKSATSRVQANGVLEGDVTSHVFSINLSGPQFTADGKFSYPYLSFDFACRQCHGDETFDIPTLPPNFTYHPSNN